MNKLMLSNMALKYHNLVIDNSCYISLLKKNQILSNIKNIGDSQKFIDFLSEFVGISIHTRINKNLFQRFDVVLPQITLNLDRLVLIGKVFCCGQKLQIFYDLAENVFVNENGEVVAINYEKLFEYFLSPESILPINILPETIQYLKKAGWYIGRKKNIDYLLEQCEKEKIELTKLQTAFLEEYIALEGESMSGSRYKINIESKFKYISSSDVTNNIMESQNPINKISTIENISFLKVGEIGNLTVPIWISSDGRLFMDQGNQLGRTVMEGWQEILLN